MTQRAIARVAVDWQVEAQPGASPADAALHRSAPSPGSRSALPVQFAERRRVSPPPRRARRRPPAPRGCSGCPRATPTAFPGELRLLSGTLDGVLVAQQTASNLHVAPGSTVTVARPGSHAGQRHRGRRRRPSLRRFAVPEGRRACRARRPRRRPDNVIILPQSTFARVEAPILASRPELIKTQIHVTLSHALPEQSRARPLTTSPSRAHNLESRLTGTGLVGDNLGAALDTARKDALYAQILFLFLGVPGSDPGRARHGADRLGRRRPAPARRGAAAHPRSLDAHARADRAGRDAVRRRASACSSASARRC